jgi:hypothetical protein
MFAAKCLVNMARGRYNYRQHSYTVKNFEGIEYRVVSEEGIIVIFTKHLRISSYMRKLFLSYMVNI